MVAVSRKQIEDYYKAEWEEIVSPKTLNLLIELTCRSYQLNQPPMPLFTKEKEWPKPQDLGQI